MVNGNKVYTDANDLGVSGRVFYFKASDSKLYKDSALTVAADGGAVFQAFLAGNLTIVNDGAIYRATSAVVDTTNAKVKVDILTVSSSTATVITAEAAIATGDTKTAADFAKIVPSA